MMLNGESPVSSPLLDKVDEFSELLYEFRFKNVAADSTPSQAFIDSLNKKRVQYGVVDGILDLFISVSGAVPSNAFARYILTPRKVMASDYELCGWQPFSVFGMTLYRHRDVIRVIFLSAFQDGNNAVFYYRTELPSIMMWYSCPEIDPSVYLSRRGANLETADVVVFQRYATGLDLIMKQVKDMGKKIVYDIDDLELAVSYNNPAYGFYNRDGVKAGIQNMLSFADVVTVSTPQLKSELESMVNGKIVVLRNKIDLQNPVWNLPKENSEKVVIGWVGGVTHFHDLRLVAGSVASVVKETGAIFKLCGYTKGGLVVDLNTNTAKHVDRTVWDDILELFKDIGNQFVVEPGVTIQEYPAMFTDMDIVIAPLEDNKFSRCKSELKAIEAGVRSLPIVCSDTIPYQVLTDGVDGFLARGPGQFRRDLKKLVLNRELREKIGGNLRKKIEREYNARNQKERANVYRSLTGASK
jgi:glycosyltransferase involved in cell wall biosynthesis